MTDLVQKTLHRLGARLAGRLSTPGDPGYADATAIWAKPAGPMPRAIAHCRTTWDVQSAIRAARDCDLPVSVRGGGHDWAGRALCEGLVIDLAGMNGVEAYLENCTARIGGGARAADVVKTTDPLGLAAVTGAVGAVGMTGLTMGGGYGPLIGRFGLALDNLLAAEVVLPDGRAVLAKPDNEPDLFWALRGGGGNFGVVTMMHHRLHPLPSVRAGMLIYPFPEARSVLQGCTEIAGSVSDALTVQVGIVTGPDGTPVVFVVPTWCGDPGEGEARVAPFLRLGTLLGGGVDTIPYGTSLSAQDAFIVNGRRTFIETCWLPSLDSAGIDTMIHAMATTIPVCTVFTHEFKGAATRVPLETTAFGLRRDHVLIDMVAYADGSNTPEGQQHHDWALAARHAFDAIALPGGYPNLLASDDPDRVAKSYGSNAERLIGAKQHYDPDNVFRSAIPLPSPSRQQNVSGTIGAVEIQVAAD
jgi:FAD/FMN-containing dehydrogenase